MLCGRPNLFRARGTPNRGGALALFYPLQKTTDLSCLPTVHIIIKSISLLSYACHLLMKLWWLVVTSEQLHPHVQFACWNASSSLLPTASDSIVLMPTGGSVNVNCR